MGKKTYEFEVREGQMLTVWARRLAALNHRIAVRTPGNAFEYVENDQDGWQPDKATKAGMVVVKGEYRKGNAWNESNVTSAWYLKPGVHLIHFAENENANTHHYTVLVRT